MSDRLTRRKHRPCCNFSNVFGQKSQFITTGRKSPLSTILWELSLAAAYQLLEQPKATGNAVAAVDFSTMGSRSCQKFRFPSPWQTDPNPVWRQHQVQPHLFKSERQDSFDSDASTRLCQMDSCQQVSNCSSAMETLPETRRCGSWLNLLISIASNDSVSDAASKTSERR